METSGSVIVSWDFSRGKDTGVLIVGTRKKGEVTIVNAFHGNEAEELYYKLTIPKVQLSSFAKEGKDSE